MSTEYDTEHRMGSSGGEVYVLCTGKGQRTIPAFFGKTEEIQENQLHEHSSKESHRPPNRCRIPKLITYYEDLVNWCTINNPIQERASIM